MKLIKTKNNMIINVNNNVIIKFKTRHYKTAY